MFTGRCLQVMRESQVYLQVQSAMLATTGTSRCCMVWGSSLGWLVFYAALTFGWKCMGIELLTCLHERASCLLQELQMEEGAQHDVCGPACMFSCRLAGFSLIGWDV